MKKVIYAILLVCAVSVSVSAQDVKQNGQMLVSMTNTHT